MFKILVVENVTKCKNNIKSVFNKNGFEVRYTSSPRKAIEELDSSFADIILISPELSDSPTDEFIRELRDNGNNTPIIVLTGTDSTENKLKALRAGADDYLIEPVIEEELILRIKNILRRCGITSEGVIAFDNIRLEYSSLTLSINGEIQTLPKKEFYLLFKLLSHPEQIFTRLQLMDEIWGMDSDTIDTTINVHINRLRKRLKGCDAFELVAIKGVGYKAVIKKIKSKS